VTGSRRFSVVALDFGVKRNILRILGDLGCRVTVLPAQSTLSRGDGACP
jgi:carbamoyl-phosphate synthase small subunit